ncbi:metallophosphoesterase [Maritimibacter sp. UBA3975]|uniref:metallophosphoesterase n=1 Tax=Maritimibacter sp. UBA3975 TaxID=1946833 RepID=UPI0025B8A1FD|nr:metallophosphoesterase [Maritimibacter sp. UBA3975]|tara:strand:+ start:22058 stop:22870 length:813 start_codon:yes stop_codon:yes gene_type:complete
MKGLPFIAGQKADRVGLFGKLFGRQDRDPQQTSFDHPLAPAEPVCVIGDIHGCLGLFTDLLDRAEAHADRPRIICVGDYVDRGERSCEVLDLLHERDGKDGFTCLQGNHEEIMLDFLTDASGHGRRWLRFGGLQTLASYGIGGVTEQSGGDAAETAAAALAEALGPEKIAWLRDMPLLFQTGTLAVVHAGADPALPMEEQSGSTFKWGHSAFGNTPREDGLWIAHGHTIVDEVVQADGVISLDTGAYATGCLSGMVIRPDGTTELIQTGK